MKRHKEFIEFINEVEKSKKILSWQYNWDDEGGEEISHSAFYAAMDFVRHYSVELFQHDLIMFTPSISGISNGTVDVYWRRNEAVFLINFKSDTTADYYGYYDNKNVELRGKMIELEINSEIIKLLKTNFTY